MPCAALERHPATPCAALRGIEVSIARDPRRLKVVYALEGNIERLRIPAPRPPRAAERLWQHTCCELFVACDGVPGYREFNFAPSGEWAAYAFKRYREDMTPLHAAPEIVVRRTPARLELEALLPLGERQKLSIGVSAVVEEEDGAISYWALRHPPGKPDFHHPQAFALELDEARH